MPIIEIDHSVISIDNNKGDVSDINKIKMLTCNDLVYSSFFENFMIKNVPCIIKNITSTWRCAKDWIENEKINYEYFINKYGDLEAPVADCDTLTYNAHCKTDLKVAKYMNYLRNNKDKLLYLKDWHLRKILPNDLFYDVPSIFASDWLNEFAVDRREDDFMFVYIGPQDSWTPLHADVYNSYSWSVNIFGKKKWILFPPGEEEKLKDPFGNLPMMVNTEICANLRYLEVIQDKDEAIFVPSGWYHQVVNMLDTISINHNWINGCNIENVWIALTKCLSSVENEILDLKDTPEFNTQCQLILKSLFGMNFLDFVEFICHIAKKRIAQVQGTSEIGYSGYTLGINHIKFDLLKLNCIMNLIENHPIFTKECLKESIKYDFDILKKTVPKFIIS